MAAIKKTSRTSSDKIQPSTLASFILRTASTLLLLQNLRSSASDVSEDARLSPAGLMRKYGYNVEVHKVVTTDGYILEVDRIPAPQTDAAEKQRTPVLLLHGILANAASFVVNLPSQSSGFLLADAGFDVWFLNNRGVPESNFHKTLTTQDKKFWEWSFEEMGFYDVPATIDYILDSTGFSKVGLLAFSQGFTTSLVLLSLRPEYNDKVNILIGYGPVANLTYLTSIVRLAMPFADPIKAVVDIFTKGSLMVSSQTQRDKIATACSGALQDICYLPTQVLAGVNPKQLNRTRIPVYVAHGLVGTSTQELVHYTQVHRRKNLVRYDYGVIENVARYHQITPPAYPLEKISVPVALFKGMSDQFADPRDTEDLSNRLRHLLVLDYVVPDPDFQHLDFIFAYNATNILHGPLITLMKNYTIIPGQ